MRPQAGDKLLLTRRQILQTAIGAAVVAALPYGLEADDLEPVARGATYQLDPGDQLVLMLTVQGTSDAVVQICGVLGGAEDTQPFYTVRIPAGQSYCCTVDGREAVVVRADPNVQVLGRRVGVDRNLGHTDYAQHEDEEGDDDDGWDGFDEAD